jgi:hypothetical protein
MKRLFVFGLILVLFALPPAMAQGLDLSLLKGVWGGVSLKNGIDPKNAVLHGGYVFELTKGFYTPLGIAYDTKLGVTNLNLPALVRVKNGIFAYGSFSPLEFSTKGVSGYNPVVGVSGGFVYLPSKMLFGSMYFGFGVSYTYKTVSQLGVSTLEKPRSLLVDSTTDEFWFTLLLFGT